MNKHLNRDQIIKQLEARNPLDPFPLSNSLAHLNAIAQVRAKLARMRETDPTVFWIRYKTLGNKCLMVWKEEQQQGSNE